MVGGVGMGVHWWWEDYENGQIRSASVLCGHCFLCIVIVILFAIAVSSILMTCSNWPS